MSINGTIRNDSTLSNHIPRIAAPVPSAPQELIPSDGHTSVTLHTPSSPQKRNVAANLTNHLYSAPNAANRTALISADSARQIPLSVLTKQLFTTDRQISHLLQRQPDFQSVTAAAFRSALHDRFPTLQLPIDPTQIYVTEYVDEVVELPGENMVTQRRPTSSMTLSDALQNTISSGHAPTYDLQKTGFFYAAGNAVNNLDQMVQGMHTTAHVAAFIEVLQQVADNSRAGYQKAHQDFWNQPDTTGQTPTAQLISAYRQQRLTEASLRADDNTLSTESERLLKRAYATDQPAALSNSLGMFSLSLQSDDATTPITLAGVLLITRSAYEPPDTTTGPVLLTIPGQGLMEFASSVSYKEMLRQWFDNRDQHAIFLRHVAQQDRNRAEDAGNGVTHGAPFRYDTISTPVVTDIIQSLLDQQNLDLTNAFNNARKQQRAPDALLDEAADLRAAFDSVDIQETRQQLLIQQFLKNAASDDRKKWFQELKQYQAALQKTQTSGLPLMRQYLKPRFLEQYTRQRIQEKLEADLQLTLDPDKVIIITSELLVHKLAEPLPTTMSLHTATRTLSELAMGNIEALDDAHRNKVTAKDTDGYTVFQLTHDYLTRMVRALDIGQRYQDLLQAHLLDSPEGKEREQQYAGFLRAQLQLDSREAKIRGDIVDESRRWVHAALKEEPIIVNGQAVQARQLRIGGQTLGGILLFATNPPLPQQPFSHSYGAWSWRPGNADAGTGKIVVYTPDAPDGIRLREFGCRVDMREHFIQNPAMRNYLLQHVTLSGQDKVKAILQQNTTRADISDSIIAGNFLHAAYRLRAKQIMDDADTRTISNSEADRQVRLERINIALDIAGILLPAKLTAPISLGRALHSFINARDASDRDNQEDALAGFIGALEHVGDAIADGLMSRKKLGGMRYSQASANGPSVQRTPMSNRNPTSGLSSNTSTNQAEKATNNISAPTTVHQSSSNVPTGMSSVEIDGSTFYYWQSANDTVTYRDLFERDPAYPTQLRSAGYGAPDAHNVWRKISLRGGGGGPSFLVTTNESVPNREIQRLVHRIEGPNDSVDFFSAEIGNRVHRLVYNFQDHSFFDPVSLSSTRYFPKYNAMQPLKPAIKRAITDTDREATLKALGINLKLPLNFNLAEPATAVPIPRLLHSVWVGGDIPATRLDSILASIENNASMAKLSEKPYEMKLYLSNRNATAYQNNLRNIRHKAPTVQVVVLENTPFYQQFKQSKYFSQYMAAIDGNGGAATNYASAADVLRYRLLHHEGGLYIDCDDTLMAPPGSININTAPTGLALDEPVSNILLGMDIQYNTSIFGSQKHNPTLDAISEESYKRFSETRELYSNQRPRRFTEAQRRTKTRQQNIENERQLYAYMRKISYVTGPNVFNKVIDDKLPDMHQLREAIKLKEHTWNFRLPASMRTNITAWAETRLPLGQINVMGSAHTWDETRR